MTRVALSIAKGGLIFLILAALVLVARLLRLEEVLRPDWLDLHVRQHGLSGILSYLGVVVILAAVGLPRQLLAFAAGYSFGALYGWLWATLGVCGGALLDFFYARLLGRKLVMRHFANKIERLNRLISKAPFRTMLLIRLLPVGHNSTTSLLSGLTGIAPLTFSVASGLGFLPQHIIFSLLGSGVSVNGTVPMLVSALLFLLSLLLGYALYRRAHSPVGGILSELGAAEEQLEKR